MPKPRDPESVKKTAVKQSLRMKPDHRNIWQGPSRFCYPTLELKSSVVLNSIKRVVLLSKAAFTNVIVLFMQLRFLHPRIGTLVNLPRSAAV